MVPRFLDSKAEGTQGHHIKYSSLSMTRKAPFNGLELTRQKVRCAHNKSPQVLCLPFPVLPSASFTSSKFLSPQYPEQACENIDRDDSEQSCGGEKWQAWVESM